MSALKTGLGKAIKRSKTVLGLDGLKAKPRVGTARTPDGVRIYAVGDVHGCLQTFESLLALIDQDLQSAPVKDHRIIMLGDYIDRGPNSAGVIERLIELKKTDNRLVALRGNHDQLLMDFMSDPLSVSEMWLTYGGRETLESYQSTVAHPYDPEEAIQQAALDLSASLPEAHRAFFDESALTHKLGDFLFVHAGISPDHSIDDQVAEDLLWIRDPFLSHEALFDYVVVHGHTPVATADVRSNRINVDTGAVFGGALSAVVLEGSRFRFLTVKTVAEELYGHLT